MTEIFEKTNLERLIVLISDDLSSNTDLAQEIFKLADCKFLSVLYLVILNNGNNTLEVIRNMATLKAITSSNRLFVEIKLTELNNWYKKLYSIIGPNDVLVCQKEQTVSNGRFKTRPVSEFISSNFNIPIYTMSGYYQSSTSTLKNWFHEFIGLVVFLLIIALFTWLQISLNQTLDGSMETIHITISFLAEITCIWAWDNFYFQ